MNQALSVGLMGARGAPLHEGAEYADALIDLTRLIEEVRFEASGPPLSSPDY